MSFKRKIEMLLEAKRLQKLSINKIEKALDLDGTIYKGVKNPHYVPDPDLVSELVRKYRIKRSWWDKDWETGTLDMFEENGTSEHIPGDNNGKEIGPVLQDLIERNEKYRLVPTIILDKYEILSNRELDSREKLLQKMLDQAEEISATKQFLLDEKDKLIAEQEEEIADLRARLNQIPPTKDA